MAVMGPLLLLLSCSFAAGRPGPGSRFLLGAEATQIATAQLSGTTGGSTASVATLQVSNGGSLDVKGTASASSDGSGFTESTVKTNGHVRQEESAPFVANAAVGLVEAVGADVATAAEAWGSSGVGPDGPRANAGHDVSAKGELTGSAGDQAVAELEQRP